MRNRAGRILVAALLAACLWSAELRGAEFVEHPFPGITYITRTDTSPRNLRMHIVLVDLTAPEIHFKLTPPGTNLPPFTPPFETVRQTTLDFLNASHAQAAINGHFFLPFPSSLPDAYLIGLAASRGSVYSAFEAPVQNYALVTDSPAINIDASNHASVVHADTSFADGKHVLENVQLWNALAGSAQIVTDGVKTIPVYLDATHPDGQLIPPGPANYSNRNSWYNLLNARTAIGLTQDAQTLVLFTVDVRPTGVSAGMRVGEVADLLISDYHVYNALNLDGGGSTTMALEDPATHAGWIVNVSSDNLNGRSGGSNLAVYSDGVAPTTRATASPGPNANGWNRTNVTVTLDAADNPGGWVDQVHYSLDGAQKSDPQVVAGHTTSFDVMTPGVTIVTYFATDAAGNEEAAETLTVRLDGAAPVISGLPVHRCTLWPPNHQMVEVATVSAADALSGVAPGSFQVTASSNEPSDPGDPDVVIAPDGSGGFTVRLRAERLGEGAGRTYTLTATARDLADNVATVTTTCTVPHDQGRP